MSTVAMTTAEEIFDQMVERRCLSVIHVRPMPGQRGLVADVRLPNEWIARQRLILDVGSDVRSLPRAIYLFLAARADAKPAGGPLRMDDLPQAQIVVAVLPGEVLVPIAERTDLHREMLLALDGPGAGGPATAGDLAERWWRRRGMGTDAVGGVGGATDEPAGRRS